MAQQSYIYGGDTGVSYDELKRKQRLAQAMTIRSSRTPRNMGEGLSAIGNALAGGIIRRRADKAERKGKDEATAIYDALLNPQPETVPGDGPSGVEQALAAPQPPGGGMSAIQGALGNEFMSEGQRSALTALMGQNMQANAPITPYQQAGLDAGASAREQAQGNADRAFGLQQQRLGLARQAANAPKPGFKMIPVEMAAKMGLPEGSYQMGPDNKVYPIGGRGTELSIGPDGSVNFSQGGRVGSVTPKSSGTPGLTALDKKYSEDFITWTTGGAADAAKSLDQLQNSLGLLESGKNITGPVTGQIPDSINAFINPEAITAREGVEEVVQRNLKVILGGQFTESEGEKLVKRAFNPTLDEAENAKRLNRLITSMRSAVDAKNSAAEYFQANGTLNGWDGQLSSMADFNAAIDGGGSAPAGDAPEGVDPSIWEFMTPEERSLWQK